MVLMDYIFKPVITLFVQKLSSKILRVWVFVVPFLKATVLTIIKIGKKCLFSSEEIAGKILVEPGT